MGEAEASRRQVLADTMEMQRQIQELVSRASAVGKMGRWVPALLAPPRSARTTAAHLEASTGDKEAGSPCQQYEIAGADDDGNHADPWADLGA